MTIRELIDKINVFDANITFDPREEVQNNLADGSATLLTFSCTEGKIHIPDLTINDMIDIFQHDVTGIYEITQKMIAPYLQDDIPEEIIFVCFLFLHEVGHWMQFKELECNVQEYTERYAELYSANIEKGSQIWANRENSSTLNEREKEALIQCQNEYRQIPGEKDADEFAIQHLLQILDIYRKSI